jgi:hypothetical protein
MAFYGKRDKRFKTCYTGIYLKNKNKKMLTLLQLVLASKTVFGAHIFVRYYAQRALRETLDIF